MAGPLDTYNEDILAIACPRKQCQAPPLKRCRGGLTNHTPRAHQVRVEAAGWEYANHIRGSDQYIIRKKAG
jgi:hypothetical protein